MVYFPAAIGVVAGGSILAAIAGGGMFVLGYVIYGLIAIFLVLIPNAWRAALNKPGGRSATGLQLTRAGQRAVPSGTTGRSVAQNAGLLSHLGGRRPARTGGFASRVAARARARRS
jgi:hypothetical protein